MIRSSSDHTVLFCIYNNYKSFPSVETYGILMATKNMICFEILMQKSDTIFNYTFQKEALLNLLNINIIQSENVISIYQTDNIIKNITQEY